MEMQAAIAALEFFANSGQTEPVTLYTDSLYVKSGITKWIQSWKNKGWKTRAGKDVLNKDLWHLLDKLNSPQVNWEHVRGHSGDFYNDRCDEIARSFSHNLTPKLQQLSLVSAVKQSYGIGDEKFKVLISDFCRKPREND
jgi:ribonuclease HI